MLFFFITHVDSDGCTHSIEQIARYNALHKSDSDFGLAFFPFWLADGVGKCKLLSISFASQPFCLFFLSHLLSTM